MDRDFAVTAKSLQDRAIIFIEINTNRRPAYLKCGPMKVVAFANAYGKSEVFDNFNMFEVDDSEGVAVLELLGEDSILTPGKKYLFRATTIPWMNSIRGILIHDSHLFAVRDALDDKLYAMVDIISTVGPKVQFKAFLLLDKGADTELMLPAMKILEMGLGEGVCLSSTSSSNRKSTILQFPTAVLLTMKFRRGEAIEVVQRLLLPSCYQDDLERAAAVFVQRKVKVSESELVGDHPAPRVPLVLDLVEHRSHDAPETRAILGAGAMKKLGLICNYQEKRVEIEETHFDE